MNRKYPEQPLLVVDDDQGFLGVATDALEHEGITHVVATTKAKEALSLLQSVEFSTIALDLCMPDITGYELLSASLEAWPSTPVVVISGFDNLEVAIECMKQGAFDYLQKPIEYHRLVTSIRHALDHWETEREILRLKKHILKTNLQHPEAFSMITTKTLTMGALFRYAEAVAGTSFPILITGETGVGKELMARAIHIASERSGPFVPVNVAGLDEALFSDTLFGHVKGAFTSADSRREGMIGKAENGTLFLDEIGDLSQEAQVKVLRLVQGGEYYPLGADKPHTTHARFILATNRDLCNLVKSGTFRADLHYRLSSHHIHIPPLRERIDDIAVLVQHMLDKAGVALQKQGLEVPNELYSILRGYGFPGNVRELEGMISDAVVRSEGSVLSLAGIKKIVGMRALGQPESSISFMPQNNYFTRATVLPTVNSAKDMLIEEAMRRTSGNETAAAKLIGISRTTLMKRLKPRE